MLHTFATHHDNKPATPKPTRASYRAGMALALALVL